MNTALIVKAVFAVLVSFLMTAYLVPLLMAVAHKLGVLDNPDGKLKQQKLPTPYLGGLALYIGFIVALALVFPFENNMFLFLIGATLLLFVGLIDDIVAMKPYQKFFGQIIAALCFLKGGFYLKEEFFLTGQLFWLVISFGWILSVINAFNLIDVMDGLAATTALCALFSFGVIATLLHASTVVLMLASLFGALLAFLYFNKPPAKIYMGDAGSLFLGGFLATVPFMLSWATFTTFGCCAPLAILFIPLVEVGTLILIRTYNGIPFYQGSPHHFSHFLQHHGWSKQQILWYVVTQSAVLLSFTLIFLTNKIPFELFIILAAFFLVVWYLVLLFGFKSSLLLRFYDFFLSKQRWFLKKP